VALVVAAVVLAACGKSGGASQAAGPHCKDHRAHAKVEVRIADKTVFTGRDVKAAKVSKDGKSLYLTVGIDASSALAEATAENLNTKLLFLGKDGTEVMAPVIKEAVTGGRVQVTGESLGTLLEAVCIEVAGNTTPKPPAKKSDAK